MKLSKYFFLGCLGLLVGCADGGPVGTGIGAISGISGNVVEVDEEIGRMPRAVAGVRVSIDEIPGLEAVSDMHGNFEIRGDFAGTVTLRFRVASLEASERFEVPEDANLVVQDIRLRPGMVDFGAARVLGFSGRVAAIDCDNGVILVDDRMRANQFLIHLTEDTVVQRGDGTATRCVAIGSGQAVAIEGAVLADRTISALTITVEPRANQPLTEVRFRGRVGLANCAASMIVLEDPNIGRTRLHLLPRTTIQDAAGQPLRCEAIQIGDRASGRGMLNLRQPGAIDALSIVVEPPRAAAR